MECGGHKEGWMKMVDYDTSSGDDCLNGWSETAASTEC